MLPPNALEVVQQTLRILSPELLLLLVAVAMMTAAPFVRLPRHYWSLGSVAAMVVALLLLLGVKGQVTDLYSAIALNDALSFNARLVLVLTGFLLLAFAHDQVDDAKAPEFFGSLLMIQAGSMMVASANEMIFLFVGLELVSIPTYLLLYLPRRTATTQEAATKYFFLSIFSSGLLLYGLAFLYGLTGVSNLKALAFLTAHVPDVPQPQLALVAVVFIIAGLGFRVAAVPFHFYAPDVYQGSPTFIAAMLAWIPKAVGFLAIARTLSAFIAADNMVSMLGYRAVLVAWIVAAITMTLGNTVALVQNDLKRLFAYSSIAHAGYLMIGVAASFYNPPGSNPTFFGTQGVLIYLVAYSLMTLGVFGVMIALSTPKKSIETVDDLTGLGSTHPRMALAMAICLFSLAGIPPLAGFYGKFALFTSAFDASIRSESNIFFWLAIIGVLNAAAGAYYYLRIVVLMYLRPAPATPLETQVAWPTATAVAVCAVLSLVLGILPAPIVEEARKSAEASIATPAPADEPIAAALAK